MCVCVGGGELLRQNITDANFCFQSFKGKKASMTKEAIH